MGESVPPEIEQAAHALALDAGAAEVVGALEARGISSILIKGPATGHWLYADDPDQRTYADVDLLVDPSRFTAAEHVLEELGFEHAHGDHRVDQQTWMYEAAWERSGPPPVYVDLHRGFHGVDDVDAFWAELDRNAASLVLAGRRVRIPDAAGCALVVALHDSSTGRTDQSATDVQRAITRFDDRVWREAARRAEAAGALASLVLGLTFHSEGRALIRSLGLPVELPPAVATRSLVESGVPAGQADRAWALQHRLGTARGGRAKVRVLRGIVFPPQEFLRDARPLARRGTIGLIAMRILYPFDLAFRAPRILWLVLRGRRRARQSRRR